MDIFIVTVLHIWNTLIPCSRMLGVVHVEYVHYHPIEDLYLSISLGMGGIRLGELSVQ